MSIFHNNALLGASGQSTGYRIERSLRFNSPDSTYLSRTAGTPTSSGTWTLSIWVKRAKIGSDTAIFGGRSGGSATQVYFKSDNTIRWYEDTADFSTTAVFRDVSSWYHFVFTKNGSSSCTIYVNGSQLQQNTTSIPSTSRFNTSSAELFIGSIGLLPSGISFYADHYLADIHFIDGQALTPSSFAETNATTGQWVPKAYSGSYGTNGFRLDFSDNSAATATTLGKDRAGSNNWTPNNLSVTAGTGRYVGSTTGSLYNGAWINAFNGSISPVDSTNWAYTYSATTSLTLAEALTGTVEIYATRPGTSNTGTHTITLSTGSSVTLTSAANNNPQWYSFGSQTNVTSITVVGGDPGIAILAVRVNGVILIDKQFGAGNDSLVDTPTSYGTGNSGGDVRGNYATLNPLASTGTLSNGNLDGTTNAKTNFGSIAYPATGKWYYELTVVSGGPVNVGIAAYVASAGNVYLITSSCLYSGSGVKNVDGVLDVPFAATFGVGDVIGVAANSDAATVAFYKNGTLQGTISHVVSGLFPAIGDGNLGASSSSLNFGQRPFAYPVSGFKALCDTNLPAPVVAKPSTVMDVKLYTGNGSTQTISGLDFSPDFLWFKGRATAYHHALYDTVRGYTKALRTNGTDSEWTEGGGLSSFNSNGFSLSGDNTVLGSTNANGQSYVAWAWDAGSSTVTNTQGSITSQVRANASAGFSIVTYTGNGSNATVGHGLNVAPEFVVFKSRVAGYDWLTYHKSLGNTAAIRLNTTDAQQTSFSTFLNNTSPNSTVVNIGNTVGVNASSGSYVAYCFAPVAGYSSFGSYTGNGSADGPFIYTGFRPRWVMTKASSSTSNWIVFDTTRLGYNGANDYLLPNSSGGEGNDVDIDILSNGFKPRDGSGPTNVSGVTYIYAAFAENPFQYARGR